MKDDWFRDAQQKVWPSDGALSKWCSFSLFKRLLFPFTQFPFHFHTLHTLFCMQSGIRLNVSSPLMLSLRGRILSSFTVNAWQMPPKKLSLSSSVYLLSSPVFSPYFFLDLMIRVQLVLCGEWRTPFGERKVVRNQDRSHIVAKWLVRIILFFKLHQVSMTSINCRRWKYLPCRGAQRRCRKQRVICSVSSDRRERQTSSHGGHSLLLLSGSNSQSSNGGNLGRIRWHFL